MAAAVLTYVKLPLMVSSVLAASVKLPVPFKVKLLAPKNTPLATQGFIAAVLIVTLSIILGIPFGVQLVAVFQLLLVAPFQV